MAIGRRDPVSTPGPHRLRPYRHQNFACRGTVAGYGLARFERRALREPRTSARDVRKPMFTRVLPCFMFVLVCTAPASAQDSPYCRRARARARRVPRVVGRGRLTSDRSARRRVALVRHDAGPRSLAALSRGLSGRGSHPHFAATACLERRRRRQCTNRNLTIRASSAKSRIMVSASSLRAWSNSNRRRDEWRLTSHPHASIKCAASTVAKMLWGSTARP
jgi:hypothetical protein